MSKWRGKAIEIFPEMRPAIEGADTLTSLWIEIVSRLQTQYDRSQESPERKHADLIRKVYKYAMWCASAEDWRTREAVEISFFESILPFAMRGGKATYDKVIADLVANIGLQEIKVRSASLSYSLTQEQKQRFLRDIQAAVNQRRRQ